jgi:hypothetical protein
MWTFLYDVDVINGIDVQHNSVRSDNGSDDRELPAMSESREYGRARVEEGPGLHYLLGIGLPPGLPSGTRSGFTAPVAPPLAP